MTSLNSLYEHVPKHSLLRLCLSLLVLSKTFFIERPSTDSELSYRSVSAEILPIFWSEWPKSFVEIRKIVSVPSHSFCLSRPWFDIGCAYSTGNAYLCHIFDRVSFRKSNGLATDYIKRSKNLILLLRNKQNTAVINLKPFKYCVNLKASNMFHWVISLQWSTNPTAGNNSVSTIRNLLVWS